jgi:hypothetical protein
MANLVRKRRRQQQRIDNRAAELNEKIARIDKVLDARGPFAPFNEFHYTLKIARAQAENDLADLAVEALTSAPSRTSARG